MSEMKINIVGPSGSGKTTLSKKLGEEFNIKPINFDYVFYKHVKSKSRVEVPEIEWQKSLQQILREKNWIMEGTKLLPNVLSQAEIIIYLKPHISTALYRQWKRYFTDSTQRHEHGFINNWKLSHYILKMYYQKEDKNRKEDLKYFRNSKADRMLTQYKEKVVVIKNKKDLKKFLLTINEASFSRTKNTPATTAQ